MYYEIGHLGKLIRQSENLFLNCQDFPIKFIGLWIDLLACCE